ncbi:MAG: Fic family protein [Candidatus Nanopelagicales bacterium]
MADACAAARDEVDQLLWDRGVRARAAEVAAESRILGARDSAALEGADVALELLRSGPEDSPLGHSVAAAVLVTAEVPSLVDVWQHSPAQALARLHAIAAAGFDDPERLGRPRRDDEVIDPLHIGTPPPASELAGRLDALAQVLTRPTRASAVLVAAIAHGELLALRPFRWGSGLVARASVRLVLAGRGVDPDLLSVPEAGMLSLGRTSYVAALRGYQSGTADGVIEWVRWNCSAIGFGAQRSR